MAEDEEIQTLEQRLQTLSVLVSRANLAAKLGQQYGADRDLYQALGYPLTIDYTDYASRYSRQDIAKAVIDRPVKVTWRGELEIVESDDDKETQLERAWKDLEERLKLKSRFVRLDKLVGIGQYGVLLLGLNDVTSSEGWIEPAIGGNKKLMYVKPFGEGKAVISKWETRTRNPRYGMPLLYDITATDVEGSSTSQIQVHYSRLLHVTGETLESEVLGTPRLEVVYNRLMDLEKLVGGDAEMFWRGARPGYGGVLDKDWDMDQQTKDDLKDQIDEYEHNLRRILIAKGMHFEPLAQQVADPKSHVDVQMQMISAVTGIPKRILTGSERGELASTQDKEEWLTFVKARREEYAEPVIVRPFIDRCVELGILPAAGEVGYTVKWEDLFAPSEKERVEIGKVRATALKEYAMSPMAEATIPPDAFLQYFLGLDKDDIDLILEMREAAMLEEQRAIAAGEIEEEPVQPTTIVTQIQADPVDWKKIYEDGGAHWLEDVQPSKFAQSFAEELIEAGKGRLLEIGCGNGKDSILFTLAGLDVIGIDVVPEAIEAAKENAERVGVEVDFQEGNAEELTFPDNSFDSVFSLSVLHATDIEKSLAEVARVLQPDGIAAIFIYSDVQRIDGTRTEFITIAEFIELLIENEFVIKDIYTDSDDEYDEAGEKHSIIITKIKK